MILSEFIDIAVHPQAVWTHLADPQALAKWHAKLVAVRRDHRGPLFAGERFGATYVMSPRRPKPADCETEVLQIDPGVQLGFRHHMLVRGSQRYVDETYQLVPNDDKTATRVHLSVNLAGAGLPLWVRPLVWCIARTGRTQGEQILEPLKRACESGGGANQSGPP